MEQPDATASWPREMATILRSYLRANTDTVSGIKSSVVGIAGRFHDRPHGLRLPTGDTSNVPWNGDLLLRERKASIRRERKS